MLKAWGRCRISGNGIQIYKGVRFADFTSFFLDIRIKIKYFGLKGGLYPMNPLWITTVANNMTPDQTAPMEQSDQDS